jgi:hypothetical protein
MARIESIFLVDIERAMADRARVGRLSCCKADLNNGPL